MNRRLLVSLVILLLLVSCTAPGDIPSPGETSSCDSSASIYPALGELELPLLSGSRARPLLAQPVFDSGSGGYFYRWPDGMEIPRTPPFESESEALSATLEWLRVHFEPLGEGVSLRGTTTRTGGIGECQVDIVECFREVPTSRIAFLEYDGRTIVRVYVALYKLEPIAGTVRRVISRDAALRRHHGGDDGPGSIRLEYASTRSFSYKGRIHALLLAPTWLFDKEGFDRVDAHTGEWWRG